MYIGLNNLGLNAVSRATGTLLSLFSGGQLGGLYDPNSLSTQFQDRFGLIPVTGTGQTVGLVLDTSKGLAITTSGAASNMDTVNWSASAGGWTGTSANSCACDGTNVATSTWTTPSANFPLVSGSIARFKFTVDSLSGSFTVFPSNASTATITSTGTYAIYGIGGNTLGFSAIAGRVISISNVSIEYVASNAIFQVTSTARPIITSDGAYYYWAFDGVDDTLATNSGSWTFGGPNNATVWVGTRKESDAASATISLLGTGRTVSHVSIYAPDGVAANYGFTTRGNVIATERTATTYTAPVANVLSIIFDNTGVSDATQIIPRINGVTPTLVDVTGPTTNSIYSASIFRIGSIAGSEFFTGRIYGLAIRAGVSSAPDITTGEQNLARYMGLTF